MNAKSLLEAIKDEEDFLSLCEEVSASTKKSQALGKTIAEFPANKRGELWRSALAAVREHGSSHPEAFGLACVLITAWLDANDKEQIPPASLIDLVAEVHDALFELHSESAVQEEASKTCERWYSESRPGRDRVLPQLVPTVILRSLETDATPVRAFNLRETLLLFDLEDESSLALKKLLLQCFVSPAHLSSNQGRKFLSFVMTLSTEIMLAAHDSIKNQLLQLKGLKTDRRADAIANFSKVYYGVWQLLRREKQNEDEEVKEKKVRLLETFETDIVQQDFMNGSIFFQDDALAKTCLKVLNAAFHDNKKDRTVDSMLAQRYESIIWRGLAAVNANVRRNAAVVLFNAFPLHDPTAKIEDISRSLQKQFDAIGTLLMDPCPDVRVTAVEGVCRVLSLYWETIPLPKSSKLLQTLVNELVHDKTSPQVRASVVRSLAYMLDFPLSQSALKIALPHLRKHLNDRSRMVRTEMAKLLVKVDSTNGFRFTDICSPSSILLRLAEDKDASSVALPLCQLLVPSFYPVEAPSVEQLKRAKTLAMTNFAASQVFFRNLHKFVDVNKVAKLALLFGSFVRARKREVSDESTRAGELDDDERQEDLEKAIEEIHVAIETICVLWESIAKAVRYDDQYSAAREALMEAFGHDAMLLPLFEWKLFADKWEKSLIRLSALVPCAPSVIMESGQQAPTTALERAVIRTIFLSKSDASLSLEAKVDLCVEWNRFERVVKEVVRSLTVYLNSDSKETKRTVDPQVCVRVLNRIAVALSKRIKLNQIKSKSSKSTKQAKHGEEGDGEMIIENQENPGQEEEEMNPFRDFVNHPGLVALFELARPRVAGGDANPVHVALALLELKLSVHLCAQRTAEEHPAPITLQRALEWCANRVDQEVEEPRAITVSAVDVKKKKKTKRTSETSLFAGLSDDEDDAAANQEEEGGAIATNYFTGVFNLAADSAAVGLDITDASVELLDAAVNQSVFSKYLHDGMGRLIYQLKLQHPQDGRIDSLLRAGYSNCEAEMDDLVGTLFSRMPESMFASFVLPVFQDGYRHLFAGKPVSLFRSFACALGALRRDPEDSALLNAVEHFARAASTSRKADVSSELIKVAERIGRGMVSDRLYNLGMEIKEESSNSD